MERIKQALDKARQERLSQPAVASSVDSNVSPSSQEVAYTQTRTVKVAGSSSSMVTASRPAASTLRRP